MGNQEHLKKISIIIMEDNMIDVFELNQKTLKMVFTASLLGIQQKE